MLSRHLLVAIAVLLGITACFFGVSASDHDDGENDLKARNLGLTDLYVFREDWQTGVDADSGNMIFIMNVNQRAVARQEYFFSTRARYQFHVTRIADVDDAATGATDMILRFEFGSPNSSGAQPITVSAVDGNQVHTATTTTSGGSILTTSLAASSNDSFTNNSVTIAGEELTVFAGLREDPFFFDVEQFFRVRAGALGTGPSVNFRAAPDAVDFAAGYNVNTLVVRVPIAFLQGSGSSRVFDVWETIFVPSQLTPGG